jgi:hypothetical protein
MDKNLKKALENNLKDLKDFQENLFDQGHTFWHCDAVDEQKKMPFYYFQRNRTVNMSTCSVCYKLIENRKKIRAIEKLLGIEQTPLRTTFTVENHIKQMSVSNASEWNPNYNYLS